MIGKMRKGGFRRHKGERKDIKLHKMAEVKPEENKNRKMKKEKQAIALVKLSLHR